MWVKPYLMRFLKGEQQVLSITGKTGSGKTVLSTVRNHGVFGLQPVSKGIDSDGYYDIVRMD
jgi:CO dehydrogenase nickel-insertion accessory protein CooC1